MKRNELKQFLDTGWYSEATLYYNGNIYWCEAITQIDNNSSTFFVDKWQAENEKDTYYHTVINSEGKVNFERVFEQSSSDLELLKKVFLESKIFEGKTFWEIEKEILWLDEGKPINR